MEGWERIAVMWGGGTRILRQVTLAPPFHAGGRAEQKRRFKKAD